MAATIPDLNTTPLGTSLGSVLVANRITPPKASIIIWITTDILIGDEPSVMVRISGSIAISTIETIAPRKISTAFRALLGSISSKEVEVVFSIFSRHTGSFKRAW